MLVLSRKVNEWIRIGPDIRIMVVTIRGDKVRIGIEAPADVVILRQELINERKEKDDAPKPKTD